MTFVQTNKRKMIFFFFYSFLTLVSLLEISNNSYLYLHYNIIIMLIKECCNNGTTNEVRENYI